MITIASRLKGYTMRADDKTTERIKEMEDCLDQCAGAVSGLSAQLDRMEDALGPMTSLFSYYGSNDWYDDREKELPEGLKAGVLSEDLVYDLITDIRDEAFRMLELATDILKNRI